MCLPYDLSLLPICRGVNSARNYISNALYSKLRVKRIEVAEAASALQEVNLSWLGSNPNDTRPEFPMVETPGQCGPDGERGADYRTVMAYATEALGTVKLTEVVIELPKCLVLN